MPKFELFAGWLTNGRSMKKGKLYWVYAISPSATSFFGTQLLHKSRNPHMFYFSSCEVRKRSTWDFMWMAVKFVNYMSFETGVESVVHRVNLLNVVLRGKIYTLIYLHMKCYVSNLNDLWFITIKSKAEKRFHAAFILFFTF